MENNEFETINGLKLIPVDYGVANRFKDEIEFNKELVKYPVLYNQVICHELKHDDSFFSIKDFKNDIYGNVNLFELVKFMFLHPKSLIQFIPFYYTRNRGFVYDVNLVLIYLFSFLVLGGTAYFAWEFI